MLCKIYRQLTLSIYAFLIAFAGHSAYIYWEYHAHPDRYAVQSAPWYVPVLTNGLFTLLIILGLLAARHITRRLRKA